MKMCSSSRHTARHCHLVTTASTSLTAVTTATSTCYIFILPSRDILTFCGSCVNTNNSAAAHCYCHVVWSVAVSGVTQLPGQVLSWAPGCSWPSSSPPGDEPLPGSSTGDQHQVSPLDLSQCPVSEQQQHFPNLQQTPGQCGGGVPHWVWGRARADKTVWPPVYVPSATTDVRAGGA